MLFGDFLTTLLTTASMLIGEGGEQQTPKIHLHDESGAKRFNGFDQGSFTMARNLGKGEKGVTSLSKFTKIKVDEPVERFVSTEAQAQKNYHPLELKPRVQENLTGIVAPELQLFAGSEYTSHRDVKRPEALYASRDRQSSDNLSQRSGSAYNSYINHSPNVTGAGGENTTSTSSSEQGPAPVQGKVEKTPHMESASVKAADPVVQKEAKKVVPVNAIYEDVPQKEIISVKVPEANTAKAFSVKVPEAKQAVAAVQDTPASSAAKKNVMVDVSTEEIQNYPQDIIYVKEPTAQQAVRVEIIPGEKPQVIVSNEHPQAVVSETLHKSTGSAPAFDIPPPPPPADWMNTGASNVPPPPPGANFVPPPPPPPKVKVKVANDPNADLKSRLFDELKGGIRLKSAAERKLAAKVKKPADEAEAMTPVTKKGHEINEAEKGLEDLNRQHARLQTRFETLDARNLEATRTGNTKLQEQIQEEMVTVQADKRKLEVEIKDKKILLKRNNDQRRALQAMKDLRLTVRANKARKTLDLSSYEVETTPIISRRAKTRTEKTHIASASQGEAIEAKNELASIGVDTITTGELGSTKEKKHRKKKNVVERLQVEATKVKNEAASIVDDIMANLEQAPRKKKVRKSRVERKASNRAKQDVRPINFANDENSTSGLNQAQEKPVVSETAKKKAKAPVQAGEAVSLNVTADENTTSGRLVSRFTKPKGPTNRAHPSRHAKASSEAPNQAQAKQVVLTPFDVTVSTETANVKSVKEILHAQVASPAKEQQGINLESQKALRIENHPAAIGEFTEFEVPGAKELKTDKTPSSVRDTHTLIERPNSLTVFNSLDGAGQKDFGQRSDLQNQIERFTSEEMETLNALVQKDMISDRAGHIEAHVGQILKARGRNNLNRAQQSAEVTNSSISNAIDDIFAGVVPSAPKKKVKVDLGKLLTGERIHTTFKPEQLPPVVTGQGELVVTDPEAKLAQRIEPKSLSQATHTLIGRPNSLVVFNSLDTTGQKDFGQRSDLHSHIERFTSEEMETLNGLVQKDKISDRAGLIEAHVTQILMARGKNNLNLAQQSAEVTNSSISNAIDDIFAGIVPSEPKKKVKIDIARLLSGEQIYTTVDAEELPPVVASEFKEVVPEAKLPQKAVTDSTTSRAKETWFGPAKCMEVYKQLDTQGQKAFSKKEELQKQIEGLTTEEMKTLGEKLDLDKIDERAYRVETIVNHILDQRVEQTAADVLRDARATLNQVKTATSPVVEKTKAARKELSDFELVDALLAQEEAKLAKLKAEKGRGLARLQEIQRLRENVRLLKVEFRIPEGLTLDSPVVKKDENTGVDSVTTMEVSTKSKVIDHPTTMEVTEESTVLVPASTSENKENPDSPKKSVKRGTSSSRKGTPKAQGLREVLSPLTNLLGRESTGRKSPGSAKRRLFVKPVDGDENVEDVFGENLFLGDPQSVVRFATSPVSSPLGIKGSVKKKQSEVQDKENGSPNGSLFGKAKDGLKKVVSFVSPRKKGDVKKELPFSPILAIGDNNWALMPYQSPLKEDDSFIEVERVTKEEPLAIIFHDSQIPTENEIGGKQIHFYVDAAQLAGSENHELLLKELRSIANGRKISFNLEDVTSEKAENLLLELIGEHFPKAIVSNDFKDKDMIPLDDGLSPNKDVIAERDSEEMLPLTQGISEDDSGIIPLLQGVSPEKTTHDDSEEMVSLTHGISEEDSGIIPLLQGVSPEKTTHDDSEEIVPLTQGISEDDSGIIPLLQGLSPEKTTHDDSGEIVPLTWNISPNKSTGTQGLPTPDFTGSSEEGKLLEEAQALLEELQKIPTPKKFQDELASIREKISPKKLNAGISPRKGLEFGETEIK